VRLGSTAIIIKRCEAGIGCEIHALATDDVFVGVSVVDVVLCGGIEADQVMRAVRIE
jgi:hypothetical protein